MASVLVCDDESVIVELLASTLESHGYLVPVAHSGAQAIELTHLHRPDLLVLDMELPDMTGLEILATIKGIESLRHTPVVFLSGVEDETTITRAAELGAAGYIIKRSMSTRILLDTIARCVRQNSDRSASSDLPLPLGFGEDPGCHETTRVQADDAGTLSWVGEWQLLGKIGRGSMGDVYLGRRGDERAALKVLPRGLQEKREALWRFAREIEVLRRLEHPHIIEFLESGTAGGHPYLAMRYIEAPDLRRHLEAHGPLGPSEAWALVGQLASALASAWSHGIVHRDIKPSNILLTNPEGQADPIHAILCDFGLACFREHFAERGDDERTLPGMVLGTPAYMSPEQARGERCVDQRQDIYGLGATLYRAVTGLKVFPGGELTMMSRRRNEDVDLAPLDRLNDLHLGTLIAEMLERDPERRIQSWLEVQARVPAV